MSKTKLHPSVQQFKQFVRKHPLLIKEVREERKTWQDLFEEWTVLGEDDEVWEKYKKENVSSFDEDDTNEENVNESSSSQGGDLLSLLKNINLNDVQGHIQNLSGMMASIQGLLQSFQSNSNQSNNKQKEGQQNPFNFREF